MNRLIDEWSIRGQMQIVARICLIYSSWLLYLITIHNLMYDLPLALSSILCGPVPRKRNCNYVTTGAFLHLQPSGEVNWSVDLKLIISQIIFQCVEFLIFCRKGDMRENWFCVATVLDSVLLGGFSGSTREGTRVPKVKAARGTQIRIFVNAFHVFFALTLVRISLPLFLIKTKTHK